MAIKKSDLYGSLWKSCDELRGGMDASQYKDYVLVILFVKYVSDRYAGVNNALLDVPKGGSFKDLLALRNKPEIGDGTNKVIAKLAEANDLRGVIDIADFNDPDKLGKGKDMVDRLSRLFTIFDNPALNFSSNNADGDDLLGDAYEYLMRHFATESGKAKGQFYTPAEVSRILSAVVGVAEASSAKQSIYDPTCGSGSLLLKAHLQALSSTGFDLAIYGQEMDNATSALAIMNMYLHGVPTAEVHNNNTLSSPHFKDGTGLKKFDFVVANPPFSNKSWTTGLDPEHDVYGRFVYGIPPKKNGDYAFLLHMLASLKPEGKAAVILPHGVLFRGNAEGTIRRALVEQGFIKAVIGLPPNLFYGTGIPACVVVLDKEGAAKRTSILMIDASRGFAKDGNKNRLRERDIHRIVDAFDTGIDVPGFARSVPATEIADARNDYNLNLPRYISSSISPDRQDLAAHLAGGIPNTDLDGLSKYWALAPSLRSGLFKRSGHAGYSALRVPLERVAELVAADEDLEGFAEGTRKNYAAWRRTHRPVLVGIDSSVKSSDLIKNLSESLLAKFKDSALLDGYALYQDLMQYWAESMRDDVEAVRTDGWVDAAKPVQVTDSSDKDPIDYTVGKAKYRSVILPRGLVVQHYCVKQAASLAKAEAELARVESSLEELVDEYGVEDGALEPALSDAGKLTKAQLKAALKEASEAGEDMAVELALLEQAAELLDGVTAAKKTVKDTSTALEAAVAAGYAGLDESKIVSLVVDEKWLAAVRGFVDSELDAVRSHLVDRITVLSDRYLATLPELEQRSEELSSTVDKHLRELGLSW